VSRLLLGPNGSGLPPEPSEPVPGAPPEPLATPEQSPDAGGPPRIGPPARPSKFFIWALITFVILEFARPPVVSELKLQVLISVALPLLIAFGKLRWWHPLMTIWIAFFALAVIHIPIAYNNYSAYGFARTCYTGVAIALCIAWLLQRRADLRLALVAWMGSMTYVALYGITHGGRGPGGFMGDENDLALACCTAFPFAFFGFERLRGGAKWIAGALAVVFVMAIVVSFSRGGFVGLAAVGLYCFYFSRRKGRNIAIGIASILAFLVFAPAEYIEEIKTIQDTQGGTAESRRFLWDAAVNMWKDNPVIGVGGGGTLWLIGEYQPTDPKYDHPSYRLRNWSGQAVHSLYFELLAEFGIVGILLYGGMVYLHFRVLNRLRRDVARRTSKTDPLRRETELFAGCLAGAMVGFLVPAIFVSVLTYPYLWYLSAFTLALDRTTRFELERRAAGGQPVRAARPAVVTAKPAPA